MMEISMNLDASQLNLFFSLDEDDKESVGEKFSMASKQCTFRMPDSWILDELHPDLLALVCLVICQPFIGKRVTMPIPVSERFSEAYTRILYREMGPVDSTLSPRESPTRPRPGLAYSGGLDSTAALSVMPVTTVPIFLDRIIEQEKQTLYDKEAAHWACNNLKEVGYPIHLIETDLEYVRDPVGFPIDVANAAPAILLSDHLRLDCIGFGTVLESAYGIGHRKYRDYINGHHFKVWGGLFHAAGLPFFQAVAGMSEVGTTIIGLRSPLGTFSQSCMRGKKREPCRNCWKCFRKLLLEALLKRETLQDEFIDSLFGIPEAKRFLMSFPIKHENVLAYATSLYDGIHPMLNLLKMRTRGDALSVEWMTRWYTPSIELIPEHYQEGLISKIAEFLEPMDQEMQDFVENWDMQQMLDDPVYHNLHEEMIVRLSEDH